MSPCLGSMIQEINWSVSSCVCTGCCYCCKCSCTSNPCAVLYATLDHALFCTAFVVNVINVCLVVSPHMQLQSFRGRLLETDLAAHALMLVVMLFEILLRFEIQFAKFAIEVGTFCSTVRL